MVRHIIVDTRLAREEASAGKPKFRTVTQVRKETPTPQP
jgi:hypothetical protein